MYMYVCTCTYICRVILARKEATGGGAEMIVINVVLIN